jgi:hypothetical protein
MEGIDRLPLEDFKKLVATHGHAGVGLSAKNTAAISARISRENAASAAAAAKEKANTNNANRHLIGSIKEAIQILRVELYDVQKELYAINVAYYGILNSYRSVLLKRKEIFNAKDILSGMKPSPKTSSAYEKLKTQYYSMPKNTRDMFKQFDELYGQKVVLEAEKMDIIDQIARAIERIRELHSVKGGKYTVRRHRKSYKSRKQKSTNK